MFTVFQLGGGTLLYQEFPALDLVEASEAQFLTSAVRDAVRTARQLGQFDARCHHYRVRAWRDSLGSRLVTVTWRVTRDGQPVAGDTYILPAP
jgi:phage baseplate assembly protein W